MWAATLVIAVVMTAAATMLIMGGVQGQDVFSPYLSGPWSQ